MLTIEQIATQGFNLLSYIIRDEAAGEGIIIDPPHHITRRHGLDSMRINAIINTHIHPDHTMGNRDLADMAPVFAHPAENTWFLRFYNNLFTFLLTGRLQPRISFTISENARIILGDTKYRGAPHTRTLPRLYLFILGRKSHLRRYGFCRWSRQDRHTGRQHCTTEKEYYPNYGPAGQHHHLARPLLWKQDEGYSCGDQALFVMGNNELMMLIK